MSFNCSQFPPGKGVTDNQSKCPECGLPNKCGLEEGKGTCWCFQFPKVDIIRDSSTCLCRRCLQKVADEM